MRALLFCGALGLMAGASANDGWWAATGAAEGFGKHEHVQMVSEEILIEIGRPPRVKVEFVFKNHGPATTVTMGFPERYSSNHDRGMENFRSWVDGRAVSVRKKVLARDFEDDDWNVVWLKDVRFAKGQERRVQVSYDADYGGNFLGELGLSYILETGSTWSGPIERCRIIVDWTSGEGYSRPYLHLFKDQWKMIGSKRAELVLENIEPDYNLHISLLPAFWHFVVDGIRIPPENSSGIFPTGAPSDILVSPGSLRDLLGRYGESDEWSHWQHPLVQRLGGELEITDSYIIVNGARIAELRRPVQVLPKERSRWISDYVHTETAEFVYLRDVVEALGGTYTYVPEDERVDITLPAEPPAGLSAPVTQEGSALAMGVQPGQRQQSRLALMLALAALVLLAVLVVLKLRARVVQSP